MGVPLYPISQTASAYKIPKAGADGKIASGFIPDLSGSIITSGLLALARGGTNADLSATGGSNQFLKQASAGAAVTVGAIAAADLTAPLTTPPAIGGTTPAAGAFTTFAATSPDAATVTATIKGAASQSADIAKYTSSTNATLAHITKDGNFVVGDGEIGAIYGFGINKSGVKHLKAIAGGSAGAFLFDNTGVFVILPSSSATSNGNESSARFYMNGSGQTMIGATSYSETLTSQLHVKQTTAGLLSSVVNTVTVGRNDSGTPLVGFGAGIAFTLKSSTTNDQAAAAFEAAWNVSTHASRASDLIDYVYYISTKQEAIRRRGASGAPQLGFYGATPVSKPALGAWAGLTTDQKLDALRDALSNLGLASYS